MCVCVCVCVCACVYMSLTSSQIIVRHVNIYRGEKENRYMYSIYHNINTVTMHVHNIMYIPLTDYQHTRKLSQITCEVDQLVNVRSVGEVTLTKRGEMYIHK